MDWRIKGLVAVIFLLAAFAVLASRAPAVLTPAHSVDDRHLIQKPSAESAIKTEHKGFFARTIDDPVAFFTAALAVLTGLLFVATFGLWSVAIRQSSDSKEAISVARDSADTAKRSLRLTEKSLEVARQSAALADRAWLSIDVEIVGPLIFRAGKIEIEIRAQTRNIGKSPAIAVYIQCDLCYDRIQAAFKAEDLVIKERNLRFVSLTNYGSALFPGSSIIFKDKLSTDIKGYKHRIASMNDVIEGIELKEEFRYSHPAVCISCRYALPGEGVNARFRHTTAVHEILHRDKNHIGFDGSEIGEISVAEVELLEAELGFKAT